MKVTGKELSTMTGMDYVAASGLLRWLEEQGTATMTLRETVNKNGRRCRPSKVYDVGDRIVVELTPPVGVIELDAIAGEEE
jgi:hypothetical protein